jgi:hypothetical protein
MYFKRKQAADNEWTAVFGVRDAAITTAPSNNTNYLREKDMQRSTGI